MPATTKAKKKAAARRKRRVVARDLRRAITPTGVQQPSAQDDGPNPFTGR